MGDFSFGLLAFWASDDTASRTRLGNIFLMACSVVSSWAWGLCLGIWDSALKSSSFGARTFVCFNVKARARSCSRLLTAKRWTSRESNPSGAVLSSPPANLQEAHAVSLFRLRSSRPWPGEVLTPALALPRAHQMLAIGAS